MNRTDNISTKNGRKLAKLENIFSTPFILLNTNKNLNSLNIMKISIKYSSFPLVKNTRKKANKQSDITPSYMNNFLLKNYLPSTYSLANVSIRNSILITKFI